MTKYNNKKTEVDGIIFDSKKEAHRYLQLKHLQDTGVISHLKLQPRFDFKLNGKLMFYYKADFEYCTDDAQRVIEDVKGVRTTVFNLKKKIIEQVYGFEITII